MVDRWGVPMRGHERLGDAGDDVNGFVDAEMVAVIQELAKRSAGTRRAPRRIMKRLKREDRAENEIDSKIDLLRF